MQVVYERCVGLDVHQKTGVACVLITSPDGTLQREIRTFSTMTADLLLLNDWLETLQVSVVALESTGVFWRPVFNLLEDGRTIVLVNPQHIKAVPGRKTDVKDAEWLADLLRHGLLTPSFIPPAPIRELRELTRAPFEPGRGARPRSEPGARCCWKARTSSWLRWPPMCWARVGGRGFRRSSPESRIQRAFRNWRERRMRSKRPELQRALDGRMLGQHRILLQHLLAHIDFLEQSRAELEAEIERCLAPFGQAVALAQSLPGDAPNSGLCHYAPVRHRYDALCQREACVPPLPESARATNKAAASA